MKGHLELFENRLKAQGEKMYDKKTAEELFIAFADALGTDEVPFYDVSSGITLADYYQGAFVRFIKSHGPHLDK